MIWQKEMPSKMSYAEAVKYSDTLTLAGYSDWRIPTIKELYSLILFTGQVRGETAITSFIDINFFDQPLGNTSNGEREIDAQTWSSTHYKGTTMNGDTTIFGVNFIDGRIKGYPKYSPRTGEANKMYFRLVRGNKDYGKNLYSENDNGTVTDSATMLMWQKADDGITRDWETSITYCESLNLGGYSDWHLPNIKELQSLVDYSRSPTETNSAAIDSIFEVSKITIPEIIWGEYPYFWSTTTHLDGVNPYAGAAYIAFGKALGKMNNNLLDVHGAGAQRSDPKSGSLSDYPIFCGPQGDAQIVYNQCRCVRELDKKISSVEMHNSSQIVVYPNPTQGNFSIQLSENKYNLSGIILYDIKGKAVFTKDIDKNYNTLYINNLISGIYTLVLTNNSGLRFTQKLVKL